VLLQHRLLLVRRRRPHRLEIADGQIRLVRWPNDEDEPEAKVLVGEDLRTVLASVSRAGLTSAGRPMTSAGRPYTPETLD
jgi:hypothetical protein